MSKLVANKFATGALRRLRAVVVAVVASAGLGACASAGLGTLSTPSLAPADKPLEENRAAAAETPDAEAAPAVAAKPVPVSIAAIKGAPAAVSGRLGKSLEAALNARNISVVKSGSAYKLSGLVMALTEGKGGKLAYNFDLESGGKRQKRISGDIAVAAGKTGDAWSGVNDKSLAEIAATTADQLSAWMAENNKDYSAKGNAALASSSEKVRANRVTTAATGESASPRLPRDILVLVAPVSGAPGDGEQSLTAAMRNSLRAKGIKLTSQASDRVYQVRGLVELGNANGGQQPVKIDWRIYAPNGKRLDHVVQSPKLPAGSLNGAWGPIAQMAADGAAADIELVLSKSKAQM